MREPIKRGFFRNLMQILAPYWRSEEWVSAWALLVVVVALSLFSVYLSVLYNYWNRDFFDAIQLNARYNVATPVNWNRGDDVIIPTSVSDEQAKTQFPGGWKAPRPYLRITPQPG